MSDLAQTVVNRMIEVALSVDKATPLGAGQKRRWESLPADTTVTLTKGVVEDILREMRRTVTVPLEVTLLALAAASGDVDAVEEKLKSLTKTLAEQEQRLLGIEHDIAVAVVGGENG